MNKIWRVYSVEVFDSVASCFLIELISSYTAAFVVSLLEKYRAAKVPVEVHIYSKGNHAFNMGNRSTLNSIKTWPQRLADWLKDTGIAVKKNR